MKTKENRPFVPYKQRVGGSNPSTPTTENQALTINFVGAFSLWWQQSEQQLSYNF